MRGLPEQETVTLARKEDDYLWIEPGATRSLEVYQQLNYEVCQFVPLSRLEAVEAERDEANAKLALVTSKTALDVVAENMAAQRRARDALARAERAEEALRAIKYHEDALEPENALSTCAAIARETLATQPKEKG